MSDEVTRSAAPESAGVTQSHPVADKPRLGAGTLDHQPQPDIGTLTHAPGGEGMTDEVGEARSPPDSLPTVPGYEILEELGRGGMGIVYKARDVKLNRFVALKMILGSGFSGSGRLIRFLAEAEAIAAVKHPYVVQVHEFGEANGHPFIALEYLPGGSLSTRLGVPIAPAIATELLGKIARGIAAMHDQGMVHRDVKPGNILFDLSGEPRVTDFGLAKRGGGTDLTATNAVLGTPSYMSPEQAKGDTKFVGPQADVWALGAILYEAITGVRPFPGENVQEVLAKVLLADPRPPRKHVHAIPRDLERICLTCLAKEPHERYPTGKHLADDLDRFARGEPISVRPAGLVERGYKWVKRNKVVASAMTAVSLVLVVGSIVSLAFGVEAQKQADRANGEATRANGEAERADREAADAIRERNAAVALRNDLAGANEDLLSYLAMKLLAPITFEEIPRTGMTALDSDLPLTVSERKAFLELAERRGGPLSYRLLEEAIRTPTGCKQLAYRTDFLLHAAIGLNLDFWDSAHDLLTTRLEMPGMNAGQRKDLTSAYLKLESPSAHFHERRVRVLLGAIDRRADYLANPDAMADSDLVTGLVEVAKRMEPNKAAEALIAAMAKTTQFDSLTKLATGLAEVVKPMEPKKAAEACNKAAGILIAAMTKTPEVWYNSLGPLGGSLAVVVKHMEPAKATEVCNKAADIIIAAMTKTTASFAPNQMHGYALISMANGLTGVIKGMDKRKVVEFSNKSADILTDAMTKTTVPYELTLLIATLAQVIKEMEPTKAAVAINKAADILITAMTKMAIPNELIQLADGLAILVKEIEPTKATVAANKAADILVTAMNKTTTPVELIQLAEALAKVVPGMDKAKAAEVCNKAVNILLPAMTKTLVTAQTVGLSRQAQLRGLAGCVAVMCNRMEAIQASTACYKAAQILSSVMTKINTLGECKLLAGCLVDLAKWMELNKGIDILASSMIRADDVKVNQILGDGLTAMTSQIKPTEAANMLTVAMSNNSDEKALQALAHVLVAITVRMEPTKAADILINAIQTWPGTSELVIGLLEVVKRLEPNKAREICNRVAESLTNSLNKHLVFLNIVGQIAASLALVAEYVEPAKAAEAFNMVADALYDAITKSTAPDTPNQRYTLGYLACGLADAAKGLAPAKATDVCTKAAEILLIEMAKPANPARWDDPRLLRNGLAMLARWMEPSKAAEVWAKVANVLTAAMTTIQKEKEDELIELVDQLIIVVRQMEPSQAAHTLIDAMTKLPPSPAIDNGAIALIEALEVATSGSTAQDRDSQAYAAVFATLTVGGPNGLLAGLPLFHPHFYPKPKKPLPPQQLVDLLKLPFCVDESRRTVLSALGLTYNREFADKWEFVRFVRENKLPLDLTTPPKRSVAQSRP